MGSQASYLAGSHAQQAIWQAAMLLAVSQTGGSLAT